MKKALKTFFGFLVILFLIAGIIAVAYYFYFKLFPEEDLNQTINLNRIVTEIPSSEEDKKKKEDKKQEDKEDGNEGQEPEGSNA